MIELAPISDREEIKNLFCEYQLDFNANSGCVKAVCDGEILGFSLYNMDKSGITIFKISPEDDLALADGVLRSTLHIAAQRSIMDAYYADKSVETFCQKLDFIKNKDEKRIDINKLFQSCCGCDKK